MIVGLTAHARQVIAPAANMKQLLRTWVERRTRGLLLKRKFPDRFQGVPLYVTPEAGLRYLFKPIAQIDPQLLDLAEEYVEPRHVVWDIGANIGLFSFAAAARATGGQVLCLEPDTWLVTILQRSVQAQPPTSAHIDVIPVALAAQPGLRHFLIAERARAANALEGYGSTQTGGVRDKYMVITLTLDWLSAHFPAPHVLKIDVEGAELEVLRGGLTLLRAAQPVIIAEIGHTETRAEVSQLLHDLGYQLFDADLPKHARQPLAQAAYNTLAIPERMV